MILLPGEAAVLAAKVAHAGEVITLALVPVEATHTPPGVKGPAELDRQLIVSGSGVQAAGHGLSPQSSEVAVFSANLIPVASWFYWGPMTGIRGG